jgi:hypothetical protein
VSDADLILYWKKRAEEAESQLCKGRMWASYHGNIEDINRLVDTLSSSSPCRHATDLEALLSRLNVEQVAMRFHYFYELFAPSCGYETRKESNVAWDDLPSANRELMLKTCEALRDYLMGKEKG